MSERVEELVALGQRRLTDEGYLAVIDWIGRASKADLERVLGQRPGHYNRRQLLAKLADELRIPQHTFHSERDQYYRGALLKRLGMGSPRAFLDGAPAGTYFEPE